MPFNPEAGLNVGIAMPRNRCICSSAETSVVIGRAPGKGGTWNGAPEDPKTAWVPLRVKRDGNGDSGYPELIR